MMMVVSGRRGRGMRLMREMISPSGMMVPVAPKRAQL
jgi:hypothetical protein